MSKEILLAATAANGVALLKLFDLLLLQKSGTLAQAGLLLFGWLCFAGLVSGGFGLLFVGDDTPTGRTVNVFGGAISAATVLGVVALALLQFGGAIPRAL